MNKISFFFVNGVNEPVCKHIEFSENFHIEDIYRIEFTYDGNRYTFLERVAFQQEMQDMKHMKHQLECANKELEYHQKLNELI